ncbi:carbohydrate kinase [uncultured Pseudodesulfovibrio sp.]|uniref:carbohydrate kinase family protein n=1 Tax=uncultured Pseudodesulfovibrio sp. TaxID=2035858 RepID=UPI0029C733C3|nr:carbohydrate kinase [uncultured Pseudodesulfovibrio sp.]
MPTFTAIGLGEILWDILPDDRKLGGAPANFAYHVNSLGGTGIPVSRIGDDDLGRETLDELSRHGISTDFITIDQEHLTGTVDAEIDSSGGATYVFPDDVAWDHLACDDQTEKLAASADAVCFGTLAQRSPISRRAIHGFLEAAPQALKVYDINLRQNFYDQKRIHTSLEMADVLKINDEELAIVTGMFGLPGEDRTALRELSGRYGLRLAVLTRGADGSLILSPDAESNLPGAPVDIIDTIGAGDSFTAAMTLAHLHGMPLDDMHRYAAQVAAFVCGQAGAMPILPAHLRIR